MLQASAVAVHCLLSFLSMAQFSAVLPGTRSADSGIWAAGVLVGGLSSAHTALVAGTEDGESGEAFGLVARSSSLPTAKRKVATMRLPALRSLSTRLRLVDGFTLFLFTDPLAAAALHRVFKLTVTSQLGAETWQALEAQVGRRLRVGPSIAAKNVNGKLHLNFTPLCCRGSCASKFSGTISLERTRAEPPVW